MRIALLLALSLYFVTACSTGYTSVGTPTPQTGQNATATQTADDATPSPSDSVSPTSPSGESTPAPELTTPPATTVPQSPTTPPPTEGPDTDMLRQEIEQIEREVVEIRQLDLLTDLDEQIISREQLRDNLEVLLEEEYSRNQAEIDILSYWLLRLVDDPDLDLYQLQLDLLSEQVAGYYDPETDELYLISDNQEMSANDKVTMAHEIVHGLQDQHFDLVALDAMTENADQSAALTALIEGDATLSMTDYLFSYLSEEELLEILMESVDPSYSTDVLDNAPRYISEGLIFSYDSGQVFADELNRSNGKTAIDQAFADPPLSTEQILHPEKYLSENRDNPIDVAIPDLSDQLGSGWELTYSDTLGEWDFMIMLEENNASNARSGYEGWGGSKFDLYESGDEAVVVLETRWDSENDAQEFLDSYLSTIANNATIGQVYSVDGLYVTVNAAGDSVSIVTSTSERIVAEVVEFLS